MSLFKLNNKRKAAAVAVSLLLASSAVYAEEAETEESKEWSVNEPQGEFYDVNINVDQGTWMNVDISPDGKTLVFDLLGDIYTMPVSGGEAKALTQDIAWQMQPTFSPDGKHIAFTSDQGGGDNIWVMQADGSNPVQISKETFRLVNSPAWSPDGDYIVARKHFTGTRSLGAGEVWMYHKAGGSGMMLTKRPNQQKDLGEPAFSPDGRYVYFSQDATPGKTFHYSKDSEKGIYKIKRYDRETGEIEVILSGRGGAIRPTPSPDGKKLAYISRVDFQSTLFIYDLETGKKTAVYDKLDRDMQETWAIHGVYPTMAWTPDNEELIFWAGGKINKLNLDDAESEVIEFNVSATKKMQKALRVAQDIDQDNFDVKMLRDVEISPDGKKVVFEALGHVYVRSLPDGKPKRLTRQDDYFELNPSFSRDGKKIVFATWNDQKQGNIRVVSSRSGKGKNLLDEPGKYIEPVFSPNGKTIVFRKTRGGYITSPQFGLNPGIYHVASDGGDAELVTENGTHPQFADRNDRIYMMRYGEMPELARIDLNGKNEQTLYTGKYATEFRVAPNGKYLAFAERFKVFVTPLTERGDVIHIGPDAKNIPVRKLSSRAGESISWNANSDKLYWSLGPELYQASLGGMFDIGYQQDEQQKPEITNLGFNKKADAPEGLIALVGGTVVTMEGEQVIENGVVLVDGKHIKAVGKKGEIDIPSSAEVIDVTGKTVMPGLIDAHAHGSQGSNEIIPQQNWSNYATLALGVTTIHDPSNDTTEVFAASELQKAGDIVAPRIFSTGTILYGASMPGYTSHVDSLEDARFHIERLKKVGAFTVKSYNQPRRNQRQQVIQAAREMDMMVVPEGGSLLQHNLSMVADGHTSLEHSISTAKIYDDIRQFWQQSETAYVPTLVVAYGGISGEHYWYDKTQVWKHPLLSKYVPSDVLAPRSMRRTTAPEHHYNHINVAKVAKEMQDLDVKVAIGAHGQREGLGSHWEMWMFAQGGMTPLEVLRTATIDSAIHLGLDNNIGSLKKGKLADIIVVDGDVLNDIRQSDKISHVMLNGRLYDANTMNEVGNYDNERKPFYFE
ncbi:amidohydrolase family protein [Thalassotalea sp. Y01]|uniref:amidohydrolase family protein n=1 Tax=Thalassotalea sp. Y01 TaxID=2729613 RepID=UPI00145DD82E|nr:amidohydrolase family protein [Thalassotalea sp. Y01]NMP15251.1 amidohydrolase family protein [Thalassotalea sp. Y01]